MDENTIREFSQKIFHDLAGSMGSAMAYVGVKNGIFKIMKDQGEMTLELIVEKTGLNNRYLEEWLKGMVCTGYLKYHPERITFELPEEHAFLLASDGTDHFMGGLFSAVPMMVGVAPKVADAFRNGGGVHFNEFGEEGVDAISLMNEGTYRQRLASYWMKSIPDIFQKLTEGCTTLDFGCGTGNVSMTLAEAFPRTTCYGIDLDLTSIQKAEQSAQNAGFKDKISFIHGNIETLEDQQFDLITILDCIHDLVDPVGILKSLKKMLRQGGSIFIVEPKAADKLEENINPIAGMYYGMSLFHCMTQSIAAGGPGLGTCMGPQKMEDLIKESGFSQFEILKIKSPVSLFYRVGI
ncbi:MAG: class I SAM-dependent methyltransferase [SAR324 cluster bacterium]|jgi:2-polyprenyl-3-methyl-5-hydroxy-6-metoxy-1,4-benzoquinol methylase|nr:class I SAM-dependent methyltransferase [SAR324 cluster bacterium]MEE1576918.1 class I SAM-dependent methyltransferase [Deltaproteobacteria bacterium]MDP6246294.1 class I SAM-dependent methyltransferase [SAR324 cluster bacterium]MDP7136950.1 class I SAM-dependent methyltransferase [SAR324 cluster bacterium]MDP7332670.1 class I SAM-dependent methyltransferase [SAR324 cluster bacterium]|tara:strand:- start:4476 stop:5528 length:1053 start_codon:yes stop_codon:yes gene_type:complete